MQTQAGPERAVVQAVPRAPIGEIVEASTLSFTAVAAEAFDPPPFGAFVKSTSDARTTYAVVAHVEHASIDPTRRAIPLGRTWEELRREQPQVLELLVTEFQAVSVAFSEAASPGINAYLPPVPPRVHDFVFVCEPQEVVGLTADLSFVRTLAASGHPASGELLAAAIRSGAEARQERRGFLLRAGREVADLYRGDYDTARAVLRRLGLRVAGDGAARPAPEKVDLRRESAK